MNRTIKFKIWDYKLGVMYQWQNVKDNFQLWHLNNSEFVCLQFTGLSDKNGVDGYEGDIVDVGDGSVNLYVIEFKWGEFRLYSINARKKNREEYHISIPVYLKTSKISGNIYENPELIK